MGLFSEFQFPTVKSALLSLTILYLECIRIDKQTRSHEKFKISCYRKFVKPSNEFVDYMLDQKNLSPVVGGTGRVGQGGTVA